MTETTTAAARTGRECRLVTIPSSGDRLLTAALYEPAGPARATLIYLHGKGGNFYTGPGRHLPQVLRSEPLRHLAINLRSHDLAYTGDDVTYRDFELGTTEADGGYWEDYETGPQDIGAAVEFALTLGSEPIVLVGTSSGGFYAPVYCARDPRVAGQVLVSPVVDNKRSLRFWFPGPDGVQRACAAARALVAAGQGRRLIPLDHWFYAVSADTLLQRAAQPDDEWSTALRHTDAALCLAWGTAETRAELWQRLFDELPTDRKRRIVVRGARHDYFGHEIELAHGIGRFVTDLLGGVL